MLSNGMFYLSINAFVYELRVEIDQPGSKKQISVHHKVFMDDTVTVAKSTTPHKSSFRIFFF